MLGLMIQTSGAASATSGWFPFSPSAPVASGSAVDASGLLVDYPGENPANLIDARGHLYAASDGHFYFPGTGKRAKFFGTNFMVNTIFPPTPDAPQRAGEYSGIVPPDTADQLATRLARMGVNVVRAESEAQIAELVLAGLQRAYTNNSAEAVLISQHVLGFKAFK